LPGYDSGRRIRRRAPRTSRHRRILW